MPPKNKIKRKREKDAKAMQAEVGKKKSKSQQPALITSYSNLSKELSSFYNNIFKSDSSSSSIGQFKLEVWNLLIDFDSFFENKPEQKFNPTEYIKLFKLLQYSKQQYPQAEFAGFLEGFKSTFLDRFIKDMNSFSDEFKGLTAIAELLKLYSSDIQLDISEFKKTKGDYISAENMENITKMYNHTIALIVKKVMPNELGVMLLKKIAPYENIKIDITELLNEIKKDANIDEHNPDVIITLPTDNIMLHAGFPKMEGSDDLVSGDTPERMVAFLKGIRSFLKNNKNLSFKFIEKAKPNKRKNEVKEGKSEVNTQSLSFYCKLSKKLGIPLIVNKNADVIVNEHTIPAIEDSIDLSKNAIEECFKYKTLAINLIRPPGHHARNDNLMPLEEKADNAEGFCFVNSVYVSAEHIAKRMKEKNKEAKNNLIIIDIDTHHGNGTETLLKEKWKEENCSVHFVNPYNAHIYAGEKHAHSSSSSSSKNVAIYNHPLTQKTESGSKKKNENWDEVLLSTVEDDLQKINVKVNKKKESIDGILVSFGLDAHKDDALGQSEKKGTAVTTEFYIQFIDSLQTKHPNTPIILFLEGGYNLRVIEDISKQLLLHLQKKKLTQQPLSLLSTSKGTGLLLFDNREKMETSESNQNKNQPSNSKISPD